jgi:hypothetical protein
MSTSPRNKKPQAKKSSKRPGSSGEAWADDQATIPIIQYLASLDDIKDLQSTQSKEFTGKYSDIFTDHVFSEVPQATGFWNKLSDNFVLLECSNNVWDLATTPVSDSTQLNKIKNTLVFLIQSIIETNKRVSTNDVFENSEDFPTLLSIMCLVMNRGLYSKMSPRQTILCDQLFYSTVSMFPLNSFQYGSNFSHALSEICSIQDEQINNAFTSLCADVNFAKSVQQDMQKKFKLNFPAYKQAIQRRSTVVSPVVPEQPEAVKPAEETTAKTDLDLSAKTETTNLSEDTNKVMHQEFLEHDHTNNILRRMQLLYVDELTAVSLGESPESRTKADKFQIIQTIMKDTRTVNLPYLNSMKEFKSSVDYKLILGRIARISKLFSSITHIGYTLKDFNDSTMSLKHPQATIEQVDIESTKRAIDLYKTIDAKFLPDNFKDIITGAESNNIADKLKHNTLIAKSIIELLRAKGSNLYDELLELRADMFGGVSFERPSNPARVKESDRQHKSRTEQFARRSSRTQQTSTPSDKQDTPTTPRSPSGPRKINSRSANTPPSQSVSSTRTPSTPRRVSSRTDNAQPTSSSSSTSSYTPRRIPSSNSVKGKPFHSNRGRSPVKPRIDSPKPTTTTTTTKGN